MKKEIIVQLDSADHLCLARGGVLTVTVQPLNRKICIVLQNIDDYELQEILNRARDEVSERFKGHTKTVGLWKNLLEFLQLKSKKPA